MKLPIVERLRTAQTGVKVPLSPHMSFVHTIEDASGPDRPRDAYETITEATFSFRQTADDSRALPELRTRATRVVLKEVYGPVEDRLHSILHMLWEGGPLYDDKVVQAVQELIDDLRP